MKNNLLLSLIVKTRGKHPQRTGTVPFQKVFRVKKIFLGFKMITYGY